MRKHCLHIFPFLFWCTYQITFLFTLHCLSMQIKLFQHFKKFLFVFCNLHAFLLLNLPASSPLKLHFSFQCHEQNPIDLVSLLWALFIRIISFVMAHAADCSIAFTLIHTWFLQRHYETWSPGVPWYFVAAIYFIYHFSNLINSKKLNFINILSGTAALFFILLIFLSLFFLCSLLLCIVSQWLIFIENSINPFLISALKNIFANISTLWLFYVDKNIITKNKNSIWGQFTNIRWGSRKLKHILPHD